MPLWLHVIIVTPFTGVWVEIGSIIRYKFRVARPVTPFTGVWVEIGYGVCSRL